MQTNSKPRNKAAVPAVPTDTEKVKSLLSDLDHLYRDWKHAIAPSEFFTAEDLAGIFKVADKSIRRWASEAPKQSLWAQCCRGRWHRMQVVLMVAVRGSFITPEAGEARWTLLRLNIARALNAEAAANQL